MWALVGTAFVIAVALVLLGVPMLAFWLDDRESLHDDPR